MLQLMIWMMAFYMVLKAVELVLIARNSPEDGRATSGAIAGFTATFAIIAAFLFVYLANQQVASMPAEMFQYPG